ncbi:MAG: MFS transporter [Candidatus Heimdallarchaeaceae archaeon]|jgi:EmrB/QacA subfamily drug resistance transporter
MQNTTVPTKEKNEPQVKIGILISATGIGVFLASLDGTIINISLKTMKDSLGVTQSSIQWVIICYLLTLIAFTTIAGDLGDRISNKIIFQIGMFIFSIASLLCFFATSLRVLIVFRVLQGIGATGLVANGIAIITRFTTEENRGLAIGLNSLIVAIAITLGPILGGVITEYLGWPYIFLVNVPVGLVGLIWVQFAIPETKPIQEKRRKADTLGSLLLASFLTLIVFGLSIFESDVINNANRWAGISLGSSFIFLVMFIFWERRIKNPIVDISMLKNRRFTIGIFTAIFAYMGLCVIIYQLPFFLQDILELSQIQTGLIILGTPVAMALSAVLAGSLSDRIDAKYIATIGVACMMIALIIGAVFVTLTVPIWLLVVIALIIGFSLGAFIAPNNNSVMSAAPKNKLGVANGMLSLSTNFGFSLGTALATSVFVINQSYFQRINGGELGDPNNYIPAMRVLFGVFAFIMLLTTILSYFRGPEDRKNMS